MDSSVIDQRPSRWNIRFRRLLTYVQIAIVLARDSARSRNLSSPSRDRTTVQSHVSTLNVLDNSTSSVRSHQIRPYESTLGLGPVKDGRNTKSITQEEEVPIWSKDANKPSSFGPSPRKRKRALLVSVSYVDLDKRRLYGWAPLPGALKDLVRVRNLLLKNGWKANEIQVLSDRTLANKRNTNSATIPTRKNIIRGIEWLLKRAKKGDFLLSHFSGHGWQIKALSDVHERDKMDEFFVPLNGDLNVEAPGFARTCRARNLLDDDLRVMLVDRLPKDCMLFNVMDCCSSGTMLDLPVEQDDGDVPEELAKNITHQSSLMPINLSQLAARSRPYPREVDGMVLHDPIPYTSRLIANDDRQIHGRVISIAACCDGDETFEYREGGGLLTTALCEVFEFPMYENGVPLSVLKEKLPTLLQSMHNEAVENDKKSQKKPIILPIPQFSFDSYETKASWTTVLHLHTRHEDDQV